MEPALSPLAVAIFAVLAAGSLLAGSKALRRLASRQPLVPYEPRRPAPWTPLDVVLVLGCYLAPALATWVLAGSRGGLATPVDIPPTEYAQLLLADAVIKLGVAAFALALLRFRAKADWHDIGLVRGKLAADLRLGAVAFLTVALPIYLLQLVMQGLFPQEQKHPVVELLMQHPHPGLLAACGLAAVVVAPLTEELLFRLLFQGCLEGIVEKGSGLFSGSETLDPNTVSLEQPERDTQPRSADNPYASPHVRSEVAHEPVAANPAPRLRGLIPIVVTSLLFASLHQWPDQVPLFFLSLALGYVYRQTHRILPSIIMHLCLNLTSLTMLWLAVQGGG